MRTNEQSWATCKARAEMDDAAVKAQKERWKEIRRLCARADREAEQDRWMMTFIWAIVLLGLFVSVWAGFKKVERVMQIHRWQALGRQLEARP